MHDQPASTFADIDLPLRDRRAGKVRISYALPEARRVFVTTDRLSAFDRIVGLVPWKGQVLNELAWWWFQATRDIVPNHAISVPDANVLLAIAADPLPVEVVVRGYITGVTSTSLWRRYELGERTAYGHRLPDGLRKNEELPRPIITPTTKAEAGGHDEPLTCAEVPARGLLDTATWARVQDAALAVFARGQQLARAAGLLLVDTKYEFGRGPDGTLLLIDEVHTPDSSRIWDAATYAARFEAGAEPDAVDKEAVRRAYTELGYRGDGAPPALPAETWAATSQRYIEAYERLTGAAFKPGSYPVAPRLEANLARAGLLRAPADAPLLLTGRDGGT